MLSVPLQSMSSGYAIGDKTAWSTAFSITTDHRLKQAEAGQSNEVERSLVTLSCISQKKSCDFLKSSHNLWFTYLDSYRLDLDLTQQDGRLTAQVHLAEERACQ